MMNGVKYYVSMVLFVILCLLDAFFIMVLFAISKEGAGAIIGVLFFLLPFLFFTKKCYSFHKKIDYKKTSSAKPVAAVFEDDEFDEPIGLAEEFRPEYEIVYVDADGRKSTRKISLLKFEGKVIEAFCFMRNERRTFYIPRILECVDLSTGEVVRGDLRRFFAKNSGKALNR